MFSDEEYDNNPFFEPRGEQEEQQQSEEPTEQQEQSEESTQTPQQSTSTQSTQQSEESQLPLRRIIPERYTKANLTLKLTQIERNKPGNPILRFDVRVHQLPRFRQELYKDVRRTYNEVVKFNKYLSVSNLECFVPVIPPAATAYPQHGEEEQKTLLHSFQQWMDRITNNPILIRDEEFVFFVENDFGYSVINPNKKMAVASGLMRKTLKQLAAPEDPYEHLDSFRPLVKGWYIEGTKLHKRVQAYSKALKQVSIQVYDLSQKLLGMAHFEEVHPGMRNLWEKLSKIQHIQSDLQLVESVNEMGTFGDGIFSITQDFYQVKEALTNRHLIMRELTQAENQTKIKNEAVEKSKARVALDPVRADDAIRQLEYAKKTQESLELQVKRISEEMLIERGEIIKFHEGHMRDIMRRYTSSKIDTHRKILKHLEGIRLDVRIVDQRGGLSRLNRDNLSSLKHNLVQSQGPGGDAWSGRGRRERGERREVREVVFDARNAAEVLGKAIF